MAYGTLSLADLQATQLNQTVAQFGENNTFEAFEASLDAHNRIMAEIIGDLAEVSTDRLRRYGGLDTMEMEDIDEFGMPKAQKVTAGSNVGFPLNAAAIGLQWTEMWFKKHTVAELRGQVDAMFLADRKRVIRDLKRSFMLSTNYTSNDQFTDKIDIDVKRLVNADSKPIPVGPNGETFTVGSHTHYAARVSTFAASDLVSLINNVKEHFSTGSIVVYINQAQEDAVTALTGFVDYRDPRVIASVNAASTNFRSLDLINIYNRPIGLFKGAEIYVKPWIPANYMFCFNAGASKPLVYRYDLDYGDGLMLVYGSGANATTEAPRDYPLRASAYRRMFGVGVWNRINGAMLYVGGTSWTDPTVN